MSCKTKRHSYAIRQLLLQCQFSLFLLRDFDKGNHDAADMIVVRLIGRYVSQEDAAS